MNLEPELTAKDTGGQGDLFTLAMLSLLAGAASGLVGALFRLSLDQADGLRDALITWAHGGKLAGLLLVTVVCAAATAIAHSFYGEFKRVNINSSTISFL